jgi:hypothetical protein
MKTECDRHRPNWRRPTISFLLAGFTLAVLGACVTAAPVTEGYPIQEAMKGKTRQHILSCAGKPMREIQDGDLTLLRYYREAPILEESSVGSKGSLPGIHHGCWATVILEGEKVEDVHYRYVPPFFDASNDCEEIFMNCAQ